ncbi:HtaA domain-containing protein [Cellulosimicrobium funkei]|nr:HtaA domain-containing protein [Cellulosimicrobium funkei]
MKTPIHRRVLRWVALATAVLLASIGLTAMPASAAPTVSITEVPDGGGQVTVSGAGFSAEAPGVYLGIGPRGLAGFYQGSTSLLEDQTVYVSPTAEVGDSAQGRTERMQADGTFSFTTTLPAEPEDGLAAYTSKAHGQGFADPSQNTTTPITYAEPAPVEEPTPTPTPTPTDEPSPEPTPTPTDEPSTPAPTPTPTDEPSTPVPSPTPTPTDEPTSSPSTSAPAGNAPRVTATAPSGGQVTVRGTGFSTADPGLYVGLGKAGQAGFYAASAAGVLVDGQTVAVATQYTDGEIDMGRTARLNADGSFALTLTLPSGATASDYAVYTSKAHGQGRTDTSQDVIVRLSGTAPSEGTGSDDDGSTPAPSTTATPTPTSGNGSGNGAGNGNQDTSGDDTAAEDTKPVYETVCAAHEVSGASLDWGLKSSFRNYIRGGIAQGGWTLGGGASYEGNTFAFGGGNGSYAKDSRTGTVAFGGSVHFTGHDGVLDLRLSNLKYRQTSPSSAVIVADVTSSSLEGDGFSRDNVTFATVNPAGLAVSENRVALSGAGATLTAAGAEAFAGFYEAGTALDPISLTLPLGEGTDCQQVLVKDGTGQYATGLQPGAAQLASTGAGTTGLLAAGGGMLALGALALVIARRTTGSHVA